MLVTTGGSLMTSTATNYPLVDSVCVCGSSKGIDRGQCYCQYGSVLPNLAAVCASIYHTIHTLTLTLTLTLILTLSLTLNLTLI